MILAGWKFSCVGDFRQHKKQLCTEFGREDTTVPGVQRIQWDRQEAKPWEGAALVVPKGRRNPTKHFSARCAKQQKDPSATSILLQKCCSLQQSSPTCTSKGFASPGSSVPQFPPHKWVTEGPWALSRSKGKVGNTSLTLWAGLLL